TDDPGAGHARGAGIPHAGGVGASRRHLACLAPRAQRLARARKAGGRAVGLRGDRPPPRPGRARARAGAGRAARGWAAREAGARAMLRRAGVEADRVDWFRIPTDRAWTRDYCPQFVRDATGSVAAVGWRFTGWAKYPNHKRDAAVAEGVARRQRRTIWLPAIGARRIVLEGGAIDVNGRGALLTTEECLLSPGQVRNPGLSRSDLERVLAHHPGVRQ